MKSFLIILNLILFFNIKSKLSDDYLEYRKYLVEKINNLHTTWKAELNPKDIRPLLGVPLDPETKCYSNKRSPRKFRFKNRIFIL